MAKVEDKILEHNYDGIQEYDNPLPGWWVYLFILTTIWGIGYIFYYHIGGFGLDQEEQFAAEMKAKNDNVGDLVLKQQKMWANISYTALTEKSDLDAGKAIFLKNCFSCHGNAGEGGIGPNLTDDYYLHGKGIENTMKTIINGVPEKGMVAWKSILKPEEVQKVASFVLSLHGSSPANPKAPQGVLIKD